MIQFQQVQIQYDRLACLFQGEIPRGEFVAIMGPNGQGKSTLLDLISGFIKPESGSIWIEGKDVTDSSPSQRPVGVMFQDNNLFQHLSAYDNIALGLSPNLRLNTAQLQRLRKVTDSLALGDLLYKLPSALSGGEAQQIAIARCLVQQRPVILLDEPFSNLDPQIRERLHELVYLQSKQYGLTTLLVTHAPLEVKPYADRVLYINQGRIVFNGTGQDFYTHFEQGI